MDQNNHNTALEFMSGSGQAQQPAHENNNVQSSGLFGTNAPITREQLATMLRYYAQEQCNDVSMGENINILS